jgi:translation initiation factor 1A
MPPGNLRGGKAYKKGKKNPEKQNVKFEPKGEGQDYARITKLLGNRRLLCFCNDGKERIGKIRGALCKGPQKEIIRIGDVVLISYREFLEADDSDDAGENTLGLKVCDILSKYDRSDHRLIKTEKGIHRDLLTETGELDGLFDEGEDGADKGKGEGEGESEDEAEVNMDDL